MNCPKCGDKLSSQKINDIEVDQCQSCSGIWFDFDELRQVLCEKTQKSLKNRIENNGGDDEASAPCPKCGGSGNMIDVLDPKHNIHIDTCSICFGQWLDGGEYEKLKGKSIFDIFK